MKGGKNWERGRNWRKQPEKLHVSAKKEMEHSKIGKKKEEKREATDDLVAKRGGQPVTEPINRVRKRLFPNVSMMDHHPGSGSDSI